MKVLMLSHLFPRPQDPSVGIFVRQQVMELSRRGVHFRILSPVPWNPPLPALTASWRRTKAVCQTTPAAWQMDGLPVVAPRYLKLPHALDFGSWGYFYYLGIRKQVRQIYQQEGFDLIHAQMLVPDGYAAVKLGRELDKPTLATERGYLAKLVRENEALRAPVRWALENLDQTIFVSEALANLAGSLGTPRRPPKVIYTGFDPDLFQPGDRLEARAQLGLPQRKTILLHIGRHEFIKGMEDILEAFRVLTAQLDHLLLCLVGGGSQTPWLQAKARQDGISDRVLFPGHQPHERIPLWLRACDLVVHPSRYEGLPNSLIEASAMARPIVATRVGGIPELVRDGETGLLVEQGNLEALTAALRQLLSNPPRAQQMGEKGRERTLARFSWKRHGDEMIQIYQSVLNSL